MKYFALVLLFSSIFACKSNQKSPPKPADQPATWLMRTPYAQLETAPCRGFCPQYRLTFRNNGWVEYEGIRFVQKMGIDSFRLTPQETIDLQNLIKTTNLWQYPETFPVTIADAPMRTVTVYDGPKKKEVRGSVELPKPIQALIEQMRQLAIGHDYNLESYDPETAAATQEVMVKLKPTVNAGNWLKQVNDDSGWQLRLVRRLGSDNLWLVAFDPKNITLDNLLTVLRANGDVLTAQENKAVQERKN
jgi:hypothetical protein